MPQGVESLVSLRRAAAPPTRCPAIALVQCDDSSLIRRVLDQPVWRRRAPLLGASPLLRLTPLGGDPTVDLGKASLRLLHEHLAREEQQVQSRRLTIVHEFE